MRKRNETDWIPKARYYELAWFCKQYPLWLTLHNRITDLATADNNVDPTGDAATSKAALEEKIFVVRDTLKEVTTEYFDVMLLCLTKGISYDMMQTKMDMPMSRVMFYRLARKFFSLLDKKRP